MFNDLMCYHCRHSEYVNTSTYEWLRKRFAGERLCLKCKLSRRAKYISRDAKGKESCFESD